MISGKRLSSSSRANPLFELSVGRLEVLPLERADVLCFIFFELSFPGVCVYPARMGFLLSSDLLPPPPPSRVQIPATASFSVVHQDSRQHRVEQR